jgi:hypothetical protein
MFKAVITADEIDPASEGMRLKSENVGEMESSW